MANESKQPSEERRTRTLDAPGAQDVPGGREERRRGTVEEGRRSDEVDETTRRRERARWMRAKNRARMMR